ncbi:MAG TPA: hypothetical protein DEB52_18380 [Hyphomonas sp.]|nr:hypothetical protein [Hyphomonas sp.]
MLLNALSEAGLGNVFLFVVVVSYATFKEFLFREGIKSVDVARIVQALLGAAALPYAKCLK